MTKEEAIERIKSRYDKWALDDKDLEAIQCTFPELAESEDEKIRKEIIAFLTHYHTGQGNSVAYNNAWIAYLEKQKEQKPEQETWPNLSNCIRDCKNCTGKCFYRKEEYQEHTPAEWSEEDERILKGIIGLIDHDQHYGVANNEMLTWLKSLRPQSHWKPSEEQMKVFNEAIKYYSKHWDSEGIKILCSLYEDLKKL